MVPRAPIVLILVLVTIARASRAGEPARSSDALPFYYDDWSLQDWGFGYAGGGYGYRPLTEEMALSAVRRFRHWRKKYGFGPDYYIVDAMWFDQRGDYRRWDPKGFPNGPKALLEAMRDAGLKLGLWYNLNSGELKEDNWVPQEPAWRTSYNPELKGYCLSEGPYLDGLRAAWEYAYNEWGLRVIKLDFATLDIPPPGKPRSSEATDANIRAFHRMVSGFRGVHPGVKFLFYNGFIYDYAQISDTFQPPHSPIINPEWLSVADWLYAGDVRPSDWPALRLRRSADFYQDHQVRRFHWAGFPLERIDDSGCFVGTGISAFELGAEDWRGTWILHLLRGGHKPHLYGDPNLLNEEDVRWMKDTYQRVSELYARGAVTEVLGGYPGEGEPFGYRLSYQGSGLVVVANPSWKRIKYRLRFENNIQLPAVVLASDGAVEIPVTSGLGFVDVEIGPSQVVLLGLGEEAARPLPSRELTPGTWPMDLEPVKIVRQSSANEELKFEAAAVPKGATLYWVVQFKNAQGRFRWDLGTKLVADQLKVKAEGGKASQVVPARPLWPGISWSVIVIKEISGVATLRLVPNEFVTDFDVAAYQAK